MSLFEELYTLREKHRKEENELIYKITLEHLKPSKTEIIAARVKLFDEERPSDLDFIRYSKCVERLKHSLQQWEKTNLKNQSTKTKL